MTTDAIGTVQETNSGFLARCKSCGGWTSTADTFTRARDLLRAHAAEMHRPVVTIYREDD